MKIADFFREVFASRISDMNKRSKSADLFSCPAGSLTLSSTEVLCLVKPLEAEILGYPFPHLPLAYFPPHLTKL